MPHFLEQIDSFIATHNLLPQNSTVIVGLSGGPDSVFLLYFLKEKEKQGHINELIAAHLDHEWRVDSKNDVIFCQDLTAKLDVPFVSSSASELNKSIKYNGSKEEIGRILRRHFLEKVRAYYNANIIALAHHLQDQEETFFIRLIRGTTLAGLIGMKPKDNFYVRPLLETNKKDIMTYLDENKIAYLNDPTNIQETYLRNRIRKFVLPALQQSDDRFDKNFLRTLHSLQTTEEFLNKLTEEIFERITKIADNTISIDLDQYFSLDSFMKRRILVYWLVREKVQFTLTESYIDEIIRFLKQPGNKEHKLHQNWSLIKKANTIFIKKMFI